MEEELASEEVEAMEVDPPRTDEEEETAGKGVTEDDLPQPVRAFGPKKASSENQKPQNRSSCKGKEGSKRMRAR